MKVLLTGANGQLGQALQKDVPKGIELVTRNRSQLDLANFDACQAAVHEERPDWVLNAGAYTSVDQAESEPELAHAVNAGAPAAFAKALKIEGGRLLQISTDFVFNGRQSSPYRPDQQPDPLGVYGASKAAGERVIREVFADDPSALILRTSWVIGPVGQNFALTMLSLHQQRKLLKVVSDQVGCPSSSLNLATACWQSIQRSADGTVLPLAMHWSDAGSTNWYQLAVAIGQIGQELGLIETPAQVQPITTADYPTPATRPSYSLLDCTSTRSALHLEGEHWESALRTLLQHVPLA